MVHDRSLNMEGGVGSNSIRYYFRIETYLEVFAYIFPLVKDQNWIVMLVTYLSHQFYIIIMKKNL
jgi:hypothetical protein